jgi:hypothetical protein
MRWFLLLVFSGFLVFVAILFLLLDVPERVITPAAFRVFDLEKDCPVLPTCFYQNPSSPYGRVILPNSKLNNLERYFGITQLDDNQAIVILGEPPNCQYWSFVPYLWSKANTTMILFASLSDGISEYTTNLNQGKIAVVMTRNFQVFEAERNYINNSGFEGTVYPLLLPNLVTSEDLVGLLFRVNIFPSPQDLADYVRNPKFSAYESQYLGIGFSPVGLNPMTLTSERFHSIPVKFITMNNLTPI